MAVGLHGAVAQVTGASSGIDEATGRALAVRGAAVDVMEPDQTRDAVERTVRDVADAIGYAVARAAHVAVRELLAGSIERER
jgi:NAD(P)-dependent dehydrogenase (short-subunit alcohol dehydrogenase family)